MKRLNTIQKMNNLNTVYYGGKESKYGGYNMYVVSTTEEDLIQTVNFQKGPRNVNNSINGVLNEDLLEIVRHRLQCFQKGSLQSRESDMALTHVEEALMWLNRRIEDRAEREVLGTYEK